MTSHDREAALVRMKRVAFGLLGLAALLYIGGTVLQARLPQWSVALGYL
ncbi:MAG: hypothetical protein JWQ11_1063, partial [Rhizobacter sp.]|nr:hypothetical protein [Rhizobacter sp.]